MLICKPALLNDLVLIHMLVLTNAPIADTPIINTPIINTPMRDDLTLDERDGDVMSGACEERSSVSLKIFC